MSRLTSTMAALAAAACLACAPVLDWREVRAPGAPVVVLMPCRPVAATRTVRLAAADVAMVLLSCEAGGSTWALAAIDMVDPARVNAALLELRESAARNLGADVGAAAVRPLGVRGATPNPGSLRISTAGHGPDGQALVEQAAFFAHATWVFQATVLGDRAAGDTAETFFDSLRAGP